MRSLGCRSFLRAPRRPFPVSGVAFPLLSADWFELGQVRTCVFSAGLRKRVHTGRARVRHWLLRPSFRRFWQKTRAPTARERTLQPPQAVASAGRLEPFVLSAETVRAWELDMGGRFAESFGHDIQVKAPKTRRRPLGDSVPQPNSWFEPPPGGGRPSALPSRRHGPALLLMFGGLPTRAPSYSSGGCNVFLVKCRQSRIARPLPQHARLPHGSKRTAASGFLAMSWPEFATGSVTVPQVGPSRSARGHAAGARPQNERSTRVAAKRSFTDKARTELFIALVGAVGTDLDLLAKMLETELSRVGHRPFVIRLSELLRSIPDAPFNKLRPDGPRDCYIISHQDAGNEFRERAGSGDAVAVLGIGAVQQKRQATGGDRKKPEAANAFIFRSLKHPDEEITLRRIYGSSLYIVAAYSPEATRRDQLAKAISKTRNRARPEPFRAKAQSIIQRDEAEASKPMGQHLRETFPRADVFFDASHPDKLREQVQRFVQIIFGHPFRTPTRDEFAMFHAKAAALRSSDLSRQVGAAITTEDGDVIAVGTNEVPKSSDAPDGHITGGLYWEGDTPDGRDFARRENVSSDMRRDALREVLDKLLQNGWLNKGKTSGSKQVARFEEQVFSILRDTTVMSIGEFGRTTHAEMAALLDAARRGVSIEGCVLYTTTFPCHNCAKHIVAAGIRKVVYIEPFPKSTAFELHADSIVVDSETPVPGKVNFKPFVGIAPKRYVDCFTKVERKNTDGSVAEWRESEASPRFGHFGPVAPYQAAEDAAFAALWEAIDGGNKA